MKTLAAGVLAFAALGGIGPTGESPRVVIVPLVGELTPAHTALVRRAAAAVRERPPDLVLFEIDTPGGRADVMLAIGDEIMKFRPVRTAAYVRPLGAGGGAWSAGAYVAISCARLYMHPGTVIGAATPVSGGGEEVPEKYVSGFREKFRARAEENGYPGALAAAMVDKDLEVHEVLMRGERKYLTGPELEKLRAGSPDASITATVFVSKGKLLTLTDRQVEETGMGRRAPDRAPIYSDARLAGPREESVGFSWSERLVQFLTSGLMSTVLLAIGVMGLWMEFQSPGFGAPGIAGIVAFVLLLFGHHLAGLAEIPEILLFAAGAALIAVEIFLVPGTGIFAVLGGLCLLAGLILSLQGFAWPRPNEAPWEVDLLLSSLGRVVVAVMAGGTLALVALRFLPRVPLFRRLVLQAEISGGSPVESGTETIVGGEGYARTPLRPAGKAEIGGRVFDVVSAGEYVAAGEPVRVDRIEGSRIVVSRVKR